MKLKISMVSLLLTFVAFTFAQEAKTYSEIKSDVAGIKTAYKSNNTWSNWFIQLGAGGQLFAGEDFEFNTDKMIDGITLVPTLSIGRWWTPYWGFRVKAQDGKFLSNLKSPIEGDDETLQENKYFNVHVDAMWNMSQYFGKYKANRVFNFIPYAGLGWYMRDALENPVPQVTTPGAVNGLTANAGLLFEFRLSKHIGLHIDLAGALMTDDDLNGVQHNGKPFITDIDAVLSATAGLTFNLGKSYFEILEPRNYELENSLNNKINELRAENEILSKRPEFCEPCPEVVAPVVVEEKVKFDPSVVVFRIGSSVVDANQHINIFKTSEFIKNTGEKIKVVGYADKATGSAAINLKLSEARAKAVAKELTSKYGIASDKIIVEWKGAAEQPFKENNWNRVVIMKQ